jgi:RNA polymerase sigma-70 factor (ECF subfamily)
MDTNLTDTALIERILKGDHDAYAVLIRQHHSRVFSICRPFFWDDRQTDEVAQDVFLKAFENLRKFRGESSFGTWLTRLAINHCKDELRKIKRRKSQSLEELVEIGQENRILSSGTSALDQSESQDFIDTLLSGLSDQDRLILSLREINGLSYQEIMEAMDLTLDAVKARLQRARKALIEKARHLLDTKNV